MSLEKSHNEDMNIVIVGHVDHGKSTVIGKLLVDTNSLPLGKFEQVQEKCRRNSKPFEYAFLIDALKDEQEQGITIDSARCFFKTKNRNYIIMDAPGHSEFLKNMVTGASRAEAALLVIDAYEGIQENSKRHCYLLSMLGIKQLCVLVNKMDLIDYNEKKYMQIMDEFKTFLSKIGLQTVSYIPISGYLGDNIVLRSKHMPWYEGNTVLEALEKFEVEKLPEDKPFRMHVQGVYKFTSENDLRRIVAGTVETGTLNIGDEVVFFPSRKKSKVKTIEGYNENMKTKVSAGYSTGFTLADHIYVKRGDIVTVAGQGEPQVATLIKVKLFWLGKAPMEKKKTYSLKLGTAKVNLWIEEIIRVLDSSTLQSNENDFIRTNDVAECVLRLEKPIAFDLLFDNFYLSRFVIIDDYEICGGGIIHETLNDIKRENRDKAIIREFKVKGSEISEYERSLIYKQNPRLIIISGLSGHGEKCIAKELERYLLNEGKITYFISGESIVCEEDIDLNISPYDLRKQQIKMLGEISKIILDAGIILIVTIVKMTNNDLEQIKTIINPEKIRAIWIGKNITSDIKYDLKINEYCSIENIINRIEVLDI